MQKERGFPLEWVPVQRNLYTPINNNGKEFYRPLTAGLGADSISLSVYFQSDPGHCNTIALEKDHACIYTG